MGFENPTPIQERTITPMMGQQDILALAPTGTGKTCAFGIPLIERVSPETGKIQCVVLCPTRELALQTAAVLKTLTSFKEGVRITTLYGGEPIGRQIAALRRRPQVVVATPGRMMDHINRRTVRLEHTNLLVLDEADRMLDMGFRDDIDTILNGIPASRQTVLFSATMSKGIRQIAEAYQKDALMIQIGQAARPVESVAQFYAEVGAQKKTSALLNLLKDKQFGKTLVFVGTKIMADTLTEKLVQTGLSALAIHGDLNQRQRDSVMEKYRAGHASILVATDVASRGIDVSNIDAVINYDIPQDSDSYLHRIGRTGRASQSGTAYTFIYTKERGKLESIMAATDSSIMPHVIEGVSEYGRRNWADDRNSKHGFSDFGRKRKDTKKAKSSYTHKAIIGVS